MTPVILITLGCIYFILPFFHESLSFGDFIATGLSSLSLLYIFSTNQFYIFVSFMMDVFTSR